MEGVEFEALCEQALATPSPSYDGIFDTNKFIENKIYNAFDVRIINTKYAEKVVANLEGERGIYFFPNKIQQAMSGRAIGENVKINFKFLGFENNGKYKICKIRIV